MDDHRRARPPEHARAHLVRLDLQLDELRDEFRLLRWMVAANLALTFAVLVKLLFRC